MISQDKLNQYNAVFIKSHQLTPCNLFQSNWWLHRFRRYYFVFPRLLMDGMQQQSHHQFHLFSVQPCSRQSFVCADPKVLRCHLPIHSVVNLDDVHRWLMSILRDHLGEICTALAVGDLSVCAFGLWVSKKMPWSSGTKSMRQAPPSPSDIERGRWGAPKMGAILLSLADKADNGPKQADGQMIDIRRMSPQDCLLQLRIP